MKKIKNLIGPTVCMGLGIILLGACEKSTEFRPSTAEGRLAVGQKMDYKSVILAPVAPIDIDTRQTTPASTSLDKGKGSAMEYYYDYRKLELYPLPKPDPDPEPWKERSNH